MDSKVINFVHPSAIIDSLVTLGQEVWVGAFSHIGSPPEHRAMHSKGHEFLGVNVGDRVVIREGVSIQTGFKRVTSIGCNTFIMGSSTIGHDAVLCNGVTISSGSHVAGGAYIGEDSNLGMGTAVHQGSIVGGFVMSSMNTSIKGEVPPFVKLMGPTGRIMGLNDRGLQRAEISGDWSQDYLNQLPRVFEGWIPPGAPADAKRVLGDWLDARIER